MFYRERLDGNAEPTKSELDFIEKSFWFFRPSINGLFDCVDLDDIWPEFGTEEKTW